MFFFSGVVQSGPSLTSLPAVLQLFSEAVFDLVREKFAELTHSWGSTSHARHKGLAGVVMTRGGCCVQVSLQR
jgi:hypothetical protein